MSRKPSMLDLLRKIHRDERGAAMSLDTILIIAVIALPIIIVVVKFAWPAINDYFWDRMEETGIERRG